MSETATPATIEEVAETVRAAARDGKAIFPCGGGTALEIGRPPGLLGVLLNLRKLTHIDDYPADDMTITVGAGITIGELSRLLADKGQMLPIDVAFPARATLGGSLATNASGPRRFGYGTLRDYVLGIDFIDAEGRRVHGGGRVVKNVAGYDLMKLHIGALGALGIIVQATLKLKPTPEKSAAVTLALKGDQIEPTLAALGRSATRPVGIELVDRATAGDLGFTDEEAAPWRLILLFEESAPAVDWQLAQIEHELTDAGGKCKRHDPTNYEELLRRLTEWSASSVYPVAFKANLLPGNVAGYCIDALRLEPRIRLLAHAGNGIVLGLIPAMEKETALATIAALRGLARGVAGGLVVTRYPISWENSDDVWGDARPDWPLMQKLKRKLDPNDLFNPGRFIFEAAAREA